MWGKWKTKQLKGWVIKIYRHFQSMTHLNIEDYKSDVNSHVWNTKILVASHSIE